MDDNYLLNNADHLEENEETDGAFNVSLSDDGDESDAASEDTDQNLQLADNNGCPTGHASESNSSFTLHAAHVLSEQEIQNLSRRKWRYEWEVAAFDSSSCNWKGTGDQSVVDVEPAMCYGLKQKLYKHWLDVYKASGGNDFHSSKQRQFFSLCNSYRDILHHNKKAFYLKGLQEDSSMMDGYIMRSLNHVFKSRDVVLKNEAKLAKNPETGKNEVLNNTNFLDRGFCRPKVNVQFLDRFTKEFGVANNEKEEDEVPLENGADTENTGPQKSSKPSDFNALFAGNSNDHFMVGIKFTRKSINLYSDFYTSDLLLLPLLV